MGILSWGVGGGGWGGGGISYHTIAYSWLYYIQQKIFFRAIIFLYSPCHYMRAWIRVLDVPGCYKRAAWAERKSALQGSGLVRTVGLCAQRRVPRAIATARDVLWNDMQSARKYRTFREAC